MKSCVQALKDFLQAFQKSDIYETAAPEKSQIREDLSRILSMAEAVTKDEPLLAVDCESLHSIKAAAAKKGFSFHAGMVTFPVGSWILDTVGEKITQCRQDQLLGKEFETVVDFAQSLKITVDNLTKKDKDGAIDIAIPNSNKMADMAAKYFSLLDSASSSAKQMLDKELEMVRDRIELLVTTLLEAGALKFEGFYAKLNEKLSLCFSGQEWSDEKSSEVLQSVQSMQAFHPWHKIQLAKLVGKGNALALEKYLASMSSLGSALQKAFPKLVSLKNAGVTESLLLSPEIRILYCTIHDQDVMEAVNKLASKMLPSIQETKALINKAVAEFLCKAASTFGDFLTGILATEPQYDSILQAKVVGTVDMPEVDDKGVAKLEHEIDFGAIYVAFSAFFAEDKTAKLAFGDKEIPVHTSFLCVAGSLLQISKYVLSVKEGVEAANVQGDFKTVIGLQIQKKDAKVDTKLSLLKTVANFFPGLTKAAQSYQEIMTKAGGSIANSDQIQSYHKKLIETLVTSFRLGLDDCAKEIDNMQGFFSESFETIRKAHAVPGIFRASVLDRDSISKLCQDETVKLVLFSASKAGAQCSIMQHYLQSVKTVTLIQTEIGSEVTSLMSVLDAFASSSNAKTMPAENDKVNLAHVTYFQGSVSLAQSMIRTLNPGETRTGLIHKCLALLDKTKVSPDPILAKKASQFLKNARYRERWIRVNELLCSWCQGEGQQEGVALYVDVQQILPYPESSSTSASLWNEDGLHFSKLGAETLGRHLAEPLRTLAATKLAACPLALAQPMPMRLEILKAEVVSPEPTEPVKWLFYGDSLTAGFHAFGRLFAPYAATLGEELRLAEPHELWVCGLSGLEATELLKKKTSTQIRDAVRRTGPGIERLLSEKTFDLAFIMLGTNDLASGEDEETFNAIKKIHEACHAVKLRTVALSVPPSQAVAKFRDIAYSREKVNDLLQQWAKVTPMTHLVDTGELLPFSKDSELWEIDGLHFSRLGSRTLGRRLAQQIAGSDPSAATFFGAAKSWALRGKNGRKDGMKAVVGETMNWKTIGKVLKVKDTLTKDVDYRAFLGRFRVAVLGGPAGGQRWAEELLGRFYGRLLALKGDAGSLEELEGFLGGDDGQVSANDALQAFRWVLGPTVTEDQSKALLRTLAAHALPDPSPVGRPLGVFEFLSRLDICFQQQASLNSKGPDKRLEKASPWARSVLSRLGRLLWMEAIDGSPKAASTRMLDIFKQFDQDGDGLLQREEFSQAVKQLLAEYKRDLPEMLTAESASDGRISELVDLVDISGDGLVNYLEFLHAFQPVDRSHMMRGIATPGRGLRLDLMEQICTTIWRNKASLLLNFKFIEEEVAPGRISGRVSKENLRRGERW
eukprot:s1162_g8.t1